MAANGTVGWGVLGCGRVADRRFAPAFSKTSDAELVAFCSRDLSKARAYARRHHARRAHQSFDALLADPDVQVVYIATPNALHAAQAVRCVRAGKHVLVDKPMATCIRDALELVGAADETGRLVGVLQQQRFHPANMHLLRLRDDGTLGKLNVLRVQIGMWYPPNQSWRGTPALSGGGVVMDLAPHALDLMMEVGGEIVRVDAQIRALQFAGEVEDFACARLDLANGAIGLLELSYCQHQYGGRVEAYGSLASFAVEGSMQSAGKYYTWFRKGATPEPIQEHVSNTDCYLAAIEDFTDAVQHAGRPAIDMMDGLRVTRLIDAIYTSARTGRTVDVVGHL
ncbi:MAG TPA: Gfo/Idh/MocA family oxidoreductase [Phycisphaerae bacterium]|nr:Gfo/Idh/MocA family oxidoreductase [Phycisphaerae bacterium]